jgi:hypothetical protein
MGVWVLDCSFQSQSSGFIPFCQPNTAMNDSSWMFHATKELNKEKHEKRSKNCSKLILDPTFIHSGEYAT